MFILLENKDILDTDVQAIVMPANHAPKVGGGLDKYIYKKAGYEKLLNARKKVGELKVSQAAVTDGFDIGGRIIHVVTPHYDLRDAEMLLYRSYKNAMETAQDEGIKTIAFPLLSAGVMGFPQEVALSIAKDALKTPEYDGVFDKVILALHDAPRNSLEHLLDGSYTDQPEEVLEEMNVIADFEFKDRKDSIHLMYQKMKKDLSVKKEYDMQKKEYERRMSADDPAFDSIVFQEIVDLRVGEGKMYPSKSAVATACGHGNFLRVYHGERHCTEELARKLVLVLKLSRRETFMLMKAGAISFPEYVNTRGEGIKYKEYDDALLSCIDDDIYDEAEVLKRYNKLLDKHYGKNRDF